MDRSAATEVPYRGTSSKGSSSREDSGWTKDQSSKPKQTMASCVSMRSDDSMGSQVKAKAGRNPSDQRTYLRQWTDSAPSCLSMKSDNSMAFNVNLKDRPKSYDQRERETIPEDPRPSCVSMKSDNSMGFNVDFKHGPKSSDPTDLKTRPEDPGPSCVSMKSDNSMGFNVNFKHGPKPSDQTERKTRPEDPGPSCVSMKSDNSMAFNVNFKDGPKSYDQMEHQTRPQDPGRSCVSMKSDSSAQHFITFKYGPNCSIERVSEMKPLYRHHSCTYIAPADDSPGMVAAECRRKMRLNLRRRFGCVFEGISKAGNPTPLNQIYTELHITEGGAAVVNEEHEIRQIETASRRPARPETTIRQEDIFRAPPGWRGAIRTVLTKGVAGIGKTVLTQKFTLDWAEEKANQDMDFIFPFTFRELNVLKDGKFSLLGLVHHFFPQTKEAGIFSLEDFQVVFVFDGLDECRLPLDFRGNGPLTDATESASVDVLLTNLIEGNLLPTARLWITTRPAAANQIPRRCVDMLTEVRGFTDPQKEEYFRRRFRDEEKSRRIISHIRKSRSLHIMCHIPVFCWISATVLEDMLKTREEEEKLPKTLTEMYIHFLVVQTKLKRVKYDGGAETDPHWDEKSRSMIESLGKLAFEQLQKGNLIFYECDLTECGLDVRAASVYSGVFTQIFREETGLFQDKVFCFVHLSVQEFLAALHVHLTFINSGVNLLAEQEQKSKTKRHENPDPKHLYQRAVEEALRSPHGHLDLFLRFLLGLSLRTNQSLLVALVTPKKKSAKVNQETAEFIKTKMSEEGVSPERSINLIHCLNELNDASLVEEIQQQLSSGRLSAEELSPAQWSALVFILLSSDKDLDVFDLKKYSPSEGAFIKMLPVVKVSSQALLSHCQLSERNCEALSSVLSSHSSCLRRLDLASNILQDSGVTLLAEGLRSPNCHLETLRLRSCWLSEGSCEALSSVFMSRSSSLRELDLSKNDLKDSGVELLCTGLKTPYCHLEALRLSGCQLSEKSCAALSSVLSCQANTLTQLDLSDNDLKDSGVKLLASGLRSRHCHLETLRLSGCLITEEGCGSLAAALSPNPSHLRELDLSYNHPGDSGVQLLSNGMSNTCWSLQTLRVDHSGKQWLKAGLKKYFCELTLDATAVNRNLNLSNSNRTVTGASQAQAGAKGPQRFGLWPQLLCGTALTGRSYWEVEWSGEVRVAVSYAAAGRAEDGMSGQSWSLLCSAAGYRVCHDKRETPLPWRGERGRVAVYADVAAGALSFYAVSSATRAPAHLFTFDAALDLDALHPGFSVSWLGSSVTLCERKAKKPASPKKKSHCADTALTRKRGAT